jgi:putative PIN family toxin of toxin-antitoxin system
MMPRIVVDTSVFTAALIGATGPNREILRRCLKRQYQPLLGNALFAEYEDVSARPRILKKCPVSVDEIQALLAAFCSVSEWVPIYYLWRPNLADEADNHLLELAAAGNAEWIVTNNVRDFKRAELRFPGIRILTPEQILEVS